MVEAAQIELIPATRIARDANVRKSANGVSFAALPELGIEEKEVERIAQAVPRPVAAALERKVYYFVPLALGARGEDEAAGDGRGDAPEFPDAGETLVAAAFSTELADRAICHRNVVFEGQECVFISARLMQDKFALAFEFFINVGHAFVDAVGVPANFGELAWGQAAAGVKGDTSQDAWESRKKALGSNGQVDEKAKTAYLDSAFSDALAVYMLSLTVDFDYADLREREYPLLAAPALAERLRMVAGLFPANSGYEFSILYRRRG